MKAGSYDVAIAGAGLAGGSLALRLAGLGPARSCCWMPSRFPEKSSVVNS